MQPLWRCPAALSAVFVLVSGALNSPKASGSLRKKASALLAHKQKLREPAWGYGDMGGVDWGNAGYAKCVMKDQSPVDLSKMAGKADVNNSKLYYRYRPYSRAIPLFNDGRVVAWTVQEWRSEEVGHIALGPEYPHQLTDYYSLFQVVVHTPSEHTFNGTRVPLELQLYHRKMSLDDGYPTEAIEGEAVVAIGFEESTSSNNLLSALGSHGAPTETGQEVLGNNEAGSSIDFASLFKIDTNDGGGAGDSAAFLTYEGSMTTPPCNTGIKWFVRADPVPASHAVLENFRKAADAVAGARDPGAGNARALQDIGGRVAIWLDATDATSLRSPQQVHDTMNTNTDPKSHDGARTKLPPPQDIIAPADGPVEVPTEPVTEDGGPVQSSTEKVVDSPMACQVNFKPSDVGAILCCWSQASIETAPDIIIERNGRYAEAQQELATVEKDLADGENHKNEQCQAYEDAKKEADSTDVGPEATAANQKASTYETGCEEAKKNVIELSNQKEGWDAKVMAVRGELQAALKKATEELEKKPGFACTQESVEIVIAKAAETDPGRASVDKLHAFPRHLAPGNPKLIAGADSGLVEMQLSKHPRLELK
jgi:carbonic anhydrase